MTDETLRCGYVALVGRPNVGKSTLLNRLVGQKVAITSRKPQTTRHPLIGIHQHGGAQLLFVDTPGIQLRPERAIDRHMNRVATGVLADVDVVVVLVDRDRLTDADQEVLLRVRNVSAYKICAINKLDWLEDKQRLLPAIERLHALSVFSDIIPISAKTNANVDRLIAAVVPHLPEGEHLFPDDQVTDRDQRFMVAEIIREKLMRQLGQELPYASTVTVESFQMKGQLTEISAIIYVERDGQKAIVIGDGGMRLKSIGSEARRDIETLVEGKVMLHLWVKVRGGWSDDDRALRNLGYT